MVILKAKFSSKPAYIYYFLNEKDMWLSKKYQLNFQVFMCVFLLELSIFVVFLFFNQFFSTSLSKSILIMVQYIIHYLYDI